MWSTILGFLGGPLINGAISAYREKLAAGNTQDRLAVDLAARELALQQREAELQGEYKRAMIGHPLEPANLAAYIFVAYFGKVVVWDVMLGWGVTDPIRGNVGEWMALIAAFLFGKRGAENVAMIVSGALRRK